MFDSRLKSKKRVKDLVLAWALLALLASVPAVLAGERTYHFGVSDQRSNVTFESNTDFEIILGSTHKLEGRVVADLEAGRGNVKAEVPVASLRTGIDMRDKHLRSGKWLNAKKFPMISFVSTKASRVSGSTWEIEGTFTLHGVSKAIKVQADVREIPAAAAKKAGLEGGDWLRVVVPFEVSLSEFGVKIPSRAGAKVNDTWKVKILAFASTKG